LELRAVTDVYAGPARVDGAARNALARARDHPLSLQEPAGWWKGRLETNVSMDAEDLLLREFLGIREERRSRLSASWIRSQQREDGSWGNFFGAPGDLSTTVESYAALRLCGDPADAEHMRRAREWILESGGVERARVFTHIWLALFGLWSWDEIPALPPELMLLPGTAPLSIYSFACWGRQTVAALTVVSAYRPVRPLPFRLDELFSGAPREVERGSLRTLRGWFGLADRFLHVYERRPLRWLRRLALARAEKWIIARQEADGSWGGIQPPWVYSMMALDLRGYQVNHPLMQAALEGLEAFTIYEDDHCWLEACQSPVWDTALAIIALRDAGVAADDPALVRAADWLLDEEIDIAGDWAVRRPALEPGGWAFEFENDNYPDIDDTAEVVLALRRVEHPDPERVEAAVQRGIRWTVGMQSSNDGWGAFDADNFHGVVEKHPFCDFGEVTDPPSSDVTAHVLEMLALEGLGDHDAARRGLDWLMREQEADGSWFGRWGVNHVYGVGAVLPALEAMGVSAADPRIRRAVDWLRSKQNEDGGFGEDCRSYVDRSWIGRGVSTASQTAWALMAMRAAGLPRDDEMVQRALGFLVRTQREDGTWDEPYYTGTGFPGDFYINYHLYRLVFPVTALGRWLVDG
jgi:squalene-hopene/tetraprenyl-beta-curcumene cyclase